MIPRLTFVKLSSTLHLQTKLPNNFTIQSSYLAFSRSSNYFANVTRNKFNVTEIRAVLARTKKSIKTEHFRLKNFICRKRPPAATLSSGVIAHSKRIFFCTETKSSLSASTVGRALFLLFVVCLTDVSAVTQEELEEFQLIQEDVTVEISGKNKLKLMEVSVARTFQTFVDEKTDSQQKTRSLFKSSDDDEPMGMDSLTIIWYLTTFTALLGFFIVMACTEKSCSRAQDSKPPETRTCPPTPCPSYKNFAPPSYDTVMRKYKSERVFIVPVHENNNFFTRCDVQPPTSVDIEKGIEITAAIKQN